LVVVQAATATAATAMNSDFMIGPPTQVLTGAMLREVEALWYVAGLAQFPYSV
jgi:hypothetical protein